LLGDLDDDQLVRDINALDQQSNCHLNVRKILEGDTDRGMEAAMYDCAQSVERIDVTFGLSRKDLVFRYLLRSGRIAKVEISERKYRSTADAALDFKNPLPCRSIGVLYFDGPRVISTMSGETLNITKKNKNTKAALFINLANAVRAALASSDPHPEFDSISFLTGILGNG
jgi:hypothetical protein